MLPSVFSGPVLAPYGYTVFPFPSRRFEFERAFREVVGRHPLPPPVEIVHRVAVHAAVDAVLRARGTAFIRKLDRYRFGHAGSTCYSPMIRTHAWECDPEFYLAEWAADDPLVLGAWDNGNWRWVLFLNRTAPTVVDAAMYLALPTYEIGLGPLDGHLRRCGIETATATLPKAIGERYLVRHLEAGFAVTREDQHRWFVARRLA